MVGAVIYRFYEQQDIFKKNLIIKKTQYICNPKRDGIIAQLVEQRTENPCVAGSIPADTTERNLRAIWGFVVLEPSFYCR